jgi:hypothetical protein
MKESAEAIDSTEAINATRDMLQYLIILLENLTKRIEGIEEDMERVKDAQNELLAGLALYERVKKFKEDFGLEEKPLISKEKGWDNMEAYCSTCTKMVPIIEPVSSLKDGRTTVRAKCKACGTQVFRTLS